MTRDESVACDRRGTPSGPEPLCAFVLVKEKYGDATAFRGHCSTHDGGQVTIAISLSDGTAYHERDRSMRQRGLR